MKWLLRLPIPAILAIVNVLIVVVVGIATGRQLPFRHPLWLLLLALLVVTVVLVVWQSWSRDGKPAKRLDEAVREIAAEQRKRVEDLLHRRGVDWNRRMAVTWLPGDEQSQPRPLDDFIDRFVKKLGVRRAVPRAMVLGPSGSGKTILAALLIDRLLDDRLLNDTQATRVPVLFRLASWNPHRTPLAQWLMLRLGEDYSALTSQFGPGVYQELVADHRIIAVLDGLDELPKPARTRALEEIDKWLNRHRNATPFVLTCRSDKYPTTGPIGRVLPAVPVIRLQAVNSEAALAYLGGGAHWAPVHRRLTDEGPQGPLAEALSSPLMLYLAWRVSLEGAPGEAPLPERLADRAAYRNQESIEGMLLDAFVPAVFRDETEFRIDAKEKKSRWAAAKAQQWLKFIAKKLAERAEHDFGWHRLDRLAPARWQVLPAVFGIVSGLVVEQGARLVGRPTGVWWGIAAGTGFATLLWLLGRSALSVISRGAEADSETANIAGSPGLSRAQLVRDEIATGIRVGMFGGLAVGLPGAFFARFLGDWTATILLGAVFGLVAGLLIQPSGAAPAPGTGLLTGLVAGPVGWLVAALVCGFPQGAQVGYAYQLPGGAAIGALQAWRSAMGFSLLDQLQIAVAFSLAVGIIIGTVIALARSRIGTLLATRRTYRDGTPIGRGVIPTIFGCAGGGAGAAAGAAMAGAGGAASGLLLGIGFGVTFGPVALRRRRMAAGFRIDALLTSLNLRVRVGLVGGLLGGFVGGLTFPAQYDYLGAGWLGATIAGGADGMQAGLAVGLIAGVVFGLRPQTIGTLPDRLRSLFGGAGGWSGLVVWAALGISAGATMGVALLAALGRFITRDADVVITTYLLAGLVLGLAAGLASWVEKQSERSPQSTLATARVSALGAAVLVGAAAGVGTWVVSTPTFGMIATVMLGVMVLGTAPWGIFVLARLRLVLTTRLPWRLMRFLQDAHELGVLRYADAGYEFCHARLRDRLADDPFTASAGGSPSGAVPTSEAARRVAPQSSAWRSMLTAGSIAGLILVVGVTGSLRPTTDPALYHDYRAAVANARLIDWPSNDPPPSYWYGTPPDPPPTFQRGYAAQLAFSIYGPGQAGINLPGIASALVSCTGQYALYRSTGPVGSSFIRSSRDQIRTGYSPAVKTGYGCANRLAVVVRESTARIFVNETYLGEVAAGRPAGQTFAAPKGVSLSVGGNTQVLLLGSSLWSFDPGRT